MLDQITKYSAKLLSDHSARPGRIAIAAQDDTMVSAGEAGLASLSEDILSRLNCLALVSATPVLPFAEFLLRHHHKFDHATAPLWSSVTANHCGQAY